MPFSEKAAVPHRDRQSIAFKQMIFHRTRRRGVTHRLHLEPQPRNQTAPPNGRGRRGQTIWKQLGAGHPVPVAVKPLAAFLFVPARVDDQILYVSPRESVGYFHHALVSRVAPGSAPFVEYDWEVSLHRRL